jgi:putative peptidoglycan lipid II flippase
MGKVKRFVSQANKQLTVKFAATLLASSTLVSAVLGIYRDRVLNTLYLDTYKVGLDAYTVAFIVPDFMLTILVSGALSVTFIPVFNQRFSNGNKKSAWQMSSSLINLMAIVTLLTSVLIIIFADPLVRYIVGPGLDESGHGLAVSMMRVIAVNPFLFAIASVIAGMQQAVGRFTFFALSPALYNLGIIIGALVLTNGITIGGWQLFEGGIMGVALGVVLGSVLQLIVSSVGLLGLGFNYEFKIHWRNKGFRKVLQLLPSRSLDQGADYLNSIVETNLASRMAEGTIRSYQQATTLHFMPINLIGVAISNAAFPNMTQRLSQGRDDLFRKEFQTILRVIVWLALPVAAVTFFARGYVVNFIKNGGDYLIASLLGILVLAIIFRSIYHILARSFYAHQDTKTPLYVSIFAIALNITLAIWFTTALDMGVYGLAWAQSLVAIVEVVILFIILSRAIINPFTIEFWHATGRMLVASTLTGLICYAAVAVMPLTAEDASFSATFPKFLAIVAVSSLVYIGSSRVLGIKESEPVLRITRKILFGKLFRSGKRQ